MAEASTGSGSVAVPVAVMASTAVGAVGARETSVIAGGLLITKTWSLSMGSPWSWPSNGVTITQISSSRSYTEPSMDSSVLTSDPLTNHW